MNVSSPTSVHEALSGRSPIIGDRSATGTIGSSIVALGEGRQRVGSNSGPILAAVRDEAAPQAGSGPGPLAKAGNGSRRTAFGHHSTPSTAIVRRNMIDRTSA